jgi:chemotaxis protein MotB
MKQTITTILSVALLLALAAVLSFGLLRKRHYDNELAQTRARIADGERKLGECEKIRDVERTSREGTEKVAAESRSEVDELRAQRAEQEKQLTAFKAMTDQFRKMIDSGKLQVSIRHGRMIVKLPAGVLFATGSADLSKEGQQAIDEVAHVLRQFPDRRFMVAGHTDSIAIGPPSAFKNNLELSSIRAVNVSRQLIREGISASRLVAAGYSEYEPIKSNASEAGRQENRRIEIELLPRIREIPEAGETHAAAPTPDSGTAKN